ncbi:MAG: Hsp20/alpha crystallin family protein [Phycisphaerae bacterium]
MTFDPFGKSDAAESWAHRVRRILDEMLNRSFVEFREHGPWLPATNVYETRAEYFICLEIAGLHADEVAVHCPLPTRVVIQGRRHQLRPAGVDGPLSVHALEIDEGPFFREIDLPETTRVDALTVHYAEGCLWIRLPKKNVDD